MTSQYFKGLWISHFDPLARHLDLTVLKPTEHALWGLISGYRDNLHVCLEHDRGLCSFSLAASHAPKQRWNVETVAALFPRIRQLPEGEQRLTLDEQVDFIRSHWRELQSMFSQERYKDILRRLSS